MVVREAVVVPVINLGPHVKSPQRRYVQREKKGEISYSFLYFNADKALWRNYDSLLKRETDERSFRRLSLNGSSGLKESRLS